MRSIWAKRLRSGRIRMSHPDSLFWTRAPFLAIDGQEWSCASIVPCKALTWKLNLQEKLRAVFVCPNWAQAARLNCELTETRVISRWFSTVPRVSNSRVCIACKNSHYWDPIARRPRQAWYAQAISWNNFGRSIESLVTSIAGDSDCRYNGPSCFEVVFVFKRAAKKQTKQMLLALYN